MNFDLETNQTSFDTVDFGAKDSLLTTNNFGWEQANLGTPTLDARAMPSLDGFTGNLADALESAEARLLQNLVSMKDAPDFLNTFQTAFGDQWNSSEAKALVDGFIAGEAGIAFEVVDAETLSGHGAFGDDRIFISNELLSNSINHPDVLDGVLLEEVGHYFDQELNAVDSPGDEGDIFARFAQGKDPSSEELQSLRDESDHSTLLFENATINIENAELSAEDRSEEIARLDAEAEQLSTASPSAAQAMYEEAAQLREIASLEEGAQQLTTASPYASQAMYEEAEQLSEETYFYSNADQSDTLLSYSSSESLLSGERVEQWQQDLDDLGYEIDVDGDFGPQTDAVTRQFQQDNGLVVDGIVGPNTLAAIEAASSNVEPTTSEIIPSNPTSNIQRIEDLAQEKSDVPEETSGISGDDLVPDFDGRDLISPTISGGEDFLNRLSEAANKPGVKGQLADFKVVTKALGPTWNTLEVVDTVNDYGFVSEETIIKAAEINGSTAGARLGLYCGVGAPACVVVFSYLGGKVAGLVTEGVIDILNKEAVDIHSGGHIPAPVSPGQDVPETSAFDDNPNVSNTGNPVGR